MSAEARPSVLDRLMELWQQPWSEPAYGEAQALLARLRSDRGVGTLDEAWAEAEAALPEGDYLTGVQIVAISPDGVKTWQVFCSLAIGTYGDTPAAALQALGARLRVPA